MEFAHKKLLCVFGSIVLVAILGGVPVSPARGRRGGHPLRVKGPPAWSLDVEALGYPAQDSGEARSEFLYGIGPLCFVGNDSILVTFVGPSATPLGTAKRLVLHALVVDRASGKIKSSLQWRTSSYSSHVTPAKGGGFAVVTSRAVILYSRRLIRVGKIPLLSPNANVGPVYMVASPGGARLLVSVDNGDSAARSAWLVDLDGPLVEAHWLAKSGPWWSDEDWLMPPSCRVTPSPGGETCPRRLALNWNTTISDGGAMAAAAGWQGLLVQYAHGGFIIPSRPWMWTGAYFVGDGVLLAWTQPQPDSLSLWLLKLPHLRIHLADWYKEFLYLPPAPAANGKSFALAVRKGWGGSELLDIGAHYSLSRILVYDLVDHSWAYRLDCKSEHIKSMSGLALSPDGSELALIKEGGILEAFRLPAVVATHH